MCYKSAKQHLSREEMSETESASCLNRKTRCRCWSAGDCSLRSYLLSYSFFQSFPYSFFPSFILVFCQFSLRSFLPPSLPPSLLLPLAVSCALLAVWLEFFRK